MPGKVGVKIKAGRNLPVMDRGSDTTDAFVEIKLGKWTHKTDVCRKSLNPQWNTDWFRFEVDDAEIQDEPLQIRLMDYDTYSANDAIGKVNISLNPLCLETATGHGKGTVLSGWIPVFDTMHGIRGEVNIIVKVDLFSDVNKFRQSSCGIPFFHSPCIPFGYRAQVIHGFVEELVVNDDPEYQWIDKIRTPRASNEARQVVFLKLSGQVQRKMGLKAINLGANAVIGFMQCFDLEGDVGVVARGIGTAVTLIKETTIQPILLDNNTLIKDTLEEIRATTATGSVISNMQSTEASQQNVNGNHHKNENSNNNSGLKTSDTIISSDAVVNENKAGENVFRSSDSDLSVTPIASDRLVAATAMMRVSQPSVNVKIPANEGMDMLEYPFLTLTKYPTGFVLHLGATVAARSVKLLERVPNPDEPEVRDSWWTELRMEIRSHTRALGCNVVLGYSESTTISDEVCVLSATGTAAVINMAYNRSISQNEISGPSKHSGIITVPIEEREETNNGVLSTGEIGSLSKENMSHSFETSNNLGKLSKKRNIIMGKNSCSICHVPYNLNSLPFNGKLQKCAICRKGRVPDVLLTTLEVPENLQLTGRGCFMQAQVVRPKKDLRSEGNAKEISDALPFLEYELHRVLINKLKAKGMNAIFALKTQMAVGERLIALVGTGTAIFISALPVPQVPKIIAGNSWTDKQKLNELQNKLHETYVRNQEIYQLKSSDGGTEKLERRHPSDTDESEDELIEIDMNHGNKDTCVLEVDDVEDLEIITSLMESYPPEGFYVVNTQTVPGMVALESVKNLQMFTQVWRAKLDMSCQNGLAKHFQRLLQTIFFKLRAMIPCAICDLKFRLDLPETDQIQLLVTGLALGLNDTNKFKYAAAKTYNNSATESENDVATSSNKRSIHEEDYIFPLDEDQMVETPTPTNNVPHYGHHSFKGRKYSPVRNTLNAKHTNHTDTNNKFQMQLEMQRKRNMALGDRYGVNISPLTFVPGGRIDKYLGNLNFFFIRESTSIRENGGISGFVHSFVTEILAVVRAHIISLGGNAMVSFYMTELLLVDNQHKNQGQCLISIGGDAVFVSYTPEG